MIHNSYKRNENIVTLSLKPIAALLYNLLLAYFVFTIARMAYLVENFSTFKEGLTFSHGIEMFVGGLKFDTTAIVYSHSLYILLMLVPLWFKETTAYHKFCRWIFVVVNALCLAINLADAVYFPFTLRRTTTSVFRNLATKTIFSAL